MFTLFSMQQKKCQLFYCVYILLNWYFTGKAPGRKSTCKSHDNQQLFKGQIWSKTFLVTYIIFISHVKGP